MVHEGVMRRSEDAEADLIRRGMSRLAMVIYKVEADAERVPKK